MFTEEQKYFLRCTYNYEVGRPTSSGMSDYEWDMYALDNEEELSRLIPTFVPYTGSWIFDVDRDQYSLLGGVQFNARNLSTPKLRDK